MRLYPRERSRHALRIEPGRLHPELHLLPHRNAKACPQFDRARDHLPSFHRAGKTWGFPGSLPPNDGFVPGEDFRAVSNIVFMGMGEPLYNFANVRDAVAVFADGDGLALSKRRITVSTAGVVPRMEELGAGLARCSRSRSTRCATSCATNSCRSTRNIPIKDLLAACRAYPGASNARRITFEYVMLKDINDSPADARELVRLLKGIPAKINLIPFNPWPGAPYECSDWGRIRSFPVLCLTRAMQAPCAPRAGATFWPLAGS